MRRKAVMAAMVIDRVPDARDHLENYLLKESPDDPRASRTRGPVPGQGRRVPGCRPFVGSGHPTRSDSIRRRTSSWSAPVEALERSRQRPGRNWLAILAAAEQQTALKQDKDWAEKTADYWTDRLVKANPKDPQVYVFRGYRQCSKGLFDNAIQDAEAALKLKPDDPEALHLAAHELPARETTGKIAGICHARRQGSSQRFPHV